MSSSPSGSILSAKTPVRGRPRCSVRAGAKPPYSSACSPTTIRAGGPYATSAVPSLFSPPSGGHGAAAAIFSCGGAVSYGHAHFPTHDTRPPLAPAATDRVRGPAPCGAVADASDRRCGSPRESRLAARMFRCPGAGMAMRSAPTFLTKGNGRFRLLFWMAIPSGRALVLRTEPRRSRVSALAGFDPYRGRLAGLTPVPRPPGCAVAAGPRGRHWRGAPQLLGVEFGRQHHMLSNRSESVARPETISRKLCRRGASPADGGGGRRQCSSVSEGASSFAELNTTRDRVPPQRLRADLGAAPGA